MGQSGSTQSRTKSKLDTLISLVLVLFLSLLSFSVGIFVGKQVSDGDYRRAMLEKDIGSARSLASQGEAAPHDSQALTDEEIASLTEEFVKKEEAAHKDQATSPPETAEAQHASSSSESAEPAREVAQDPAGYRSFSKPPQGAQPTHAAAPVSPQAERVAKGLAPTPDQPKKPEVRKPDSVIPPVANSIKGKFTIQVAAYADEPSAQQHASQLKDKGLDSFYRPAVNKGQTWYRVSVGLFPDRHMAQKFQAQLKSDANINNSFITHIDGF